MNSRAVKLMLNKYVQVITLTFKRLIKKLKYVNSRILVQGEVCFKKMLVYRIFSLSSKFCPFRF